MVKRILGVSLATVMALSSVVSAFAVTPADGQLTATGIYADSTGSVVADKDAVDINGVVGKDTTQGKYSQYDIVVDGYTGTTMDETESETEVYATVLPSFMTRIPKVLVLSAAGECEFAVSVKGDISGAQTVLIKPEAEQFDMVEVDPLTGNPIGKKDNVPATIEVEDIDWTYATDFKTVDAVTYVDHAGSILADGLTAGSWRGTFNFSISLDIKDATTNYTIEEIEADATLFMLGKTRPEYVVADFNDDFTEVVITKNGEDSDGIMQDFAAETSPIYSYNTTLESVEVKHGVTTIGNWVFNACFKITNVALPNTITSIGNYAFSSCTKLPKIKIPYGVMTIGERAFSGCKSITQLTIPDSVTFIDEYAFASASALEKITLSKNITSIESRAFYYCTSLKEIDIPEGVTSIESAAFDDCSSLKSIKLPSTLKSIGPGAFSDCSSLETIVIPEGITKIQGETFSGCTSLTSVTVPESISMIHNDIFRDTALKTIYGVAGSYAETYANNNGYTFIAI